MIIINRPFTSAKAYVISMGDTKFRVYANNEAEATEYMAHYLISKKINWYFDTVEAMIIDTSNMQFCPKYNIYLPDFKIQEV